MPRCSRISLAKVTRSSARAAPTMHRWVRRTSLPTSDSCSRTSPSVTRLNSHLVQTWTEPSSNMPRRPLVVDEGNLPAIARLRHPLDDHRGGEDRGWHDCMVGTSGGTSVAPDADRPGRGGGCRAERRGLQRLGCLGARPASSPSTEADEPSERRPPSRIPPRPRESWRGRVSTSASCRPTCWFRGREAAVVDTGVGGSLDAIVDVLDEAGPGVSGVRHVVLTHKHPDHAGSIGEVLAAATQATGYVGEADLSEVDATATAHPAEGWRRGVRAADDRHSGAHRGPRGGLRRRTRGSWSRATR